MANNRNDNDKKNLYYLNELSDYKVAGDDPDVRGWEVKDADNRVIGKVDNLLVNKSTERVVYLDVEVDKSIIEADHDPFGKPSNEDVHEFINKEGENHIIIPIGLVNLNEDDNYVYTDSINHQTFAETKRIEKGANVNREYEVVVLDSYDRDNRNDRSRASGSTTSNQNDRRDTDSNFDREVSRRDNDKDGNTATNRDIDLDRDSNRRDSSFDADRDRRDKDHNDNSAAYRDSDSDRDRNRRDSSYDADRARSDKGHNGNTAHNRDSDFDRDGNRRDSSTDANRDRDRRDVERDRGTSGDLQNIDGDRDSGLGGRGRDNDDDSFYDRREFERRNYRKGR